jgi:two-component system response regulator HydG
VFPACSCYSSYNTPPCEASRPFTLRLYQRFPVHCSVTYHAGPFQGEGIVWIWDVLEARRWQEPFSSFGCQYDEFRSLTESVFTRNINRMYALDQILGASDRMTEVRDLIHRVADSPCHVLITGERGTGKELVAKVIHDMSTRRTASFVPAPCSAMSEAAWEPELFEEAHKGTLFLDEIGELPLPLQAKLVQTIEDKKVQRTGAAKSSIVDVRVIASTTVNLEKEVKAKRFRGDLYYRLHVVEIDLPPLRDRREDIPMLAEAFLKRYSQEYAKTVRRISESALHLLKKYSWPGNVRELESVLERAVTLSHAREILPGDLPAAVQEIGSGTQIRPIRVRRAKTLKQVEEEYIRLTLDKTGDNKSQAAHILGVDRKTLYRRLAEMEKKTST